MSADVADQLTAVVLPPGGLGTQQHVTAPCGTVVAPVATVVAGIPTTRRIPKDKLP